MALSLHMAFARNAAGQMVATNDLRYVGPAFFHARAAVMRSRFAGRQVLAPTSGTCVRLHVNSARCAPSTQQRWTCSSRAGLSMRRRWHRTVVDRVSAA
jgi:hypothetical protein